jgi:Zn-dependent peptidase ImmA (M78 family)
MASSIPALVKPELLVWARERSAYTLPVAAAKLKVAVERLREWEQGERAPSIPQLRKLAELYKRPIAVFFLPEPPTTFDAMRDFRRIASGSEKHSPALELEIRRAHMRRDIALEIRDETDWDVPVFGERIEGAPIDAVGLARFARRLLGIELHDQAEVKGEPYAALSLWTSAVERLGVLVFHAAKVELAEMRGFSVYHPLLPVIALNAKDSPRGRLFTLLHELAHLLLRSDGLCDEHDSSDPTDPEVLCNQVAASILVPSEALSSETIVRSLVGGRISDEQIQGLASRYAVSREVIVRRLLTLGKVSPRFYQGKRDEYLASVTKETSGSPPYHVLVVRNLGKQYVRAVLGAYYQDAITASALADYLGVRLKTVPRIEQIVFKQEAPLSS